MADRPAHRSGTSGDSPAQQGTARQRGRALPWTAMRRFVQALAFLAFLALFVWSRRGGWPPSLVNAPMRLDPLAMLGHLLASRTLLVGSALALISVALTFVLGRVWCGWLCPVGTLLDWFPLGNRPREQPAVSEQWRGVKYGLLAAVLAAAALMNLTLMVFDPLTILFRTLGTSVWPALDQLITALETALYHIRLLQPAVGAFDGIVRPTVLPIEPVFYRFALPYAAILLGVIGLNLAAPRFWCRSLCPLGGLLGLLAKVGLVRRQVDSGCTECGACARICPTGTIRPDRAYASDPGECTVCMACLTACPVDAIRFPARLASPDWTAYDPARRHLLASLGAAIVGVGLFRGSLATSRSHVRLIRPPGAWENNLLGKCIRCGECTRACPTSAIQPALTEAGLEGLWTPVLVPRSGYCDYSCNACGQICPAQAIPPLSLEDKRRQIIGKAYIDESRCIAWADHQDCIVCEEMCPVPDKAIVLDEAQVVNDYGELVTVQQPHVVRERCIGCGICEYKCPVSGEAAIRVYAPADAPATASF